MDGRPRGRAAIQRNFARLEKWAGRNLTNFNKEKSKVLPLGRNNPRHQDVPWAHTRSPFPPLLSCDLVIFWTHVRLKDPAVWNLGWWDRSMDVNEECGTRPTGTRACLGRVGGVAEQLP